MAVFAGPGDADPSSALAAVRRARPDLVIVLGDLGSSAANARRNAAALGRLRVPVLFIAGGGDLHPILDAALEDAAPVVDASRLRTIRLGQVELVPVAGAPGGRYARSEDACGIGDDDVESFTAEVGSAEDGVTRYLLSWAAPSPAPGLGGVDAGSPLVARIAEAVGAHGAIYAWPRESADAIPPIAGPWPERSDGSRAPAGVTMFRVDRHGLRRADSP